MTKPVAIITGISGQDGAYLARLLLYKGYSVHGTSRDAEMSSFDNLSKLKIRDDVTVHSASLNDFRSMLNLITTLHPTEIYNLAGQSSVGLSFSQPVESFESIAVATLNILECIRFSKLPIRFFNAISSECFGNTAEPATEDTAFQPCSPYAMAKATAFWATRTYRSAYKMHTCNGILSNHESPLRPERFVCRKIVAAACRIASGSKETLYLGNVHVQRDWGLASEYVEGIWRILNHDTPDDYILATGATHPLSEFITEVFDHLGLQSKDHIFYDHSLLRPYDLPISRLNPAKAELMLGWRARTSMSELVPLLISCERTGKFG